MRGRDLSGSRHLQPHLSTARSVCAFGSLREIALSDSPHLLQYQTLLFSVAQQLLPFVQPRPFIRQSQHVQVLWRRDCIVHPFPQQWTAVDHIDGELATLVLVREVAPQLIVWIQTANGLERERLNTPRLERLVIVADTFSVGLNAVAQPAGMLLEGGLEPTIT